MFIFKGLGVRQLPVVEGWWRLRPQHHVPNEDTVDLKNPQRHRLVEMLHPLILRPVDVEGNILGRPIRREMRGEQRELHPACEPS